MHCIYSICPHPPPNRHPQGAAAGHPSGLHPCLGGTLRSLPLFPCLQLPNTAKTRCPQSCIIFPVASSHSSSASIATTSPELSIAVCFQHLSSSHPFLPTTPYKSTISFYPPESRCNSITLLTPLSSLNCIVSAQYEGPPRLISHPYPRIRITSSHRHHSQRCSPNPLIKQCERNPRFIYRCLQEACLP